MRKLRIFIAAAALALCSVFGPASVSAVTPIRFAVKGGLTINSLKFNEDAFDSDNRTGYTLGGMLQLSTPLGIGFDASLMFTHRSAKAISESETQEYEYIDVTISRNYIEIPINLRWNIGLPLIGKFVTPYIATGPDFSFLVSDQNVKDAWHSQTFDFAWNFGFGLRIMNKVELGAAYGIGLNDSASGESSLYGPVGVDCKNRFWTITAAWLF